MAKLIYSMITSVDGYVEDESGGFGWDVPEKPEAHEGPPSGKEQQFRGKGGPA